MNEPVSNLPRHSLNGSITSVFGALQAIKSPYVTLVLVIAATITSLINVLTNNSVQQKPVDSEIQIEIKVVKERLDAQDKRLEKIQDRLDSILWRLKK